MLGFYLVAGLMLGVLPASFPVALILSAVVVDNSPPPQGAAPLDRAGSVACFLRRHGRSDFFGHPETS